MPRVKLFLFGPPRLERDGQRIQIKRRKAMALLSYLTVTAKLHSRDALASLFWAEHSQTKARANLRRELSTLNKLLNQGQLAVDREQVGLAEQANLWLDVTQFQAELSACEGHFHPALEICPACIPHLTAAVTLYSQDFLAGFTLADSPDFDEWQFFQNETLRQALGGALERLTHGLAEQSDFAAAIPHARRWVALDPLHEPAQRHLMQVYDWAGQQAAALRQYKTYVELLAAELGVPPGETVTTWYNHLRDGTKRDRLLIAGQYTLDHATESLIGRGGLGEVYRGTDIQTGQAVAIKVLQTETSIQNPESLARFIREGETLRQLNHPNIVHLLATEEKAGQHFLVMDYISGGSLDRLLAEQGPLPLERVVEIGLDLADALTRAHRLGIIHRDLKPSNVLLDENGSPCLTDFGVARVKEGGPLTQTGVVMGTLDYLSPEACNGETLNEATDIWALGVILYELLTGLRPFRGETPGAILAAILTQPPSDLSEHRSDVPAALVNLIGQMLEKSLRHRIQSIRLVGAALETVQRGAEAGPQPDQEIAQRSVTSTDISYPGHTIAPGNNLPLQTTPFIGRDTELTRIRHLLLDEPECRMLTLVGAGGIGKTRLAVQSATEVSNSFADGVYFIPLVGINDASFLISAIIEGLNLTISGGVDPNEQLIIYLQGRQMLLLLDNFEHLLSPLESGLEEAIDLLSKMMQAAPRLKLLITSRERLRLPEEWGVDLEGLLFPQIEGLPDAVDPEKLATYSAIDLFIQRARRAQAGFKLTAEEAPFVAQICQWVAGMPLGLELAAAWVRMMSCQEIAQEIARSYDFLTTSMRGLPARHQSLRAVFDYSWNRLTAAEQDLLARLSVFRGGFSRDAVQQVAEATLLGLSNLVDKSLVRAIGNRRYEVHELLRQFSAEKLAAKPDEPEQSQSRHCHYYLTFLRNCEPNLKGAKQKETVDAITTDLENVRAAWRWAIARQEVKAICLTGFSLWFYHEMEGRFQAAERLYQVAVEGLEQTRQKSIWHTLAYGQSLADRSWFSLRSGHPNQSDILYQQARSILETLLENNSLDHQQHQAVQYALARALANLGAGLGVLQSQYERGRVAIQKSLPLWINLNDGWGQAWSKTIEANLAEYAGSYEAAEKHYQQAAYLLTDCQEEGYLLAYALNALGRIACFNGAYDTSQQMLDKGLQLRRRFNTRNGIAMSHLALGDLMEAQQKFDQAKKHHQDALVVTAETGDQHTIAYAQAALGRISRLEGDFSQAAALTQQSLDRCQKMNEIVVLSLNHANLGHLALARGDTVQAGFHFHRSLNQTQSIEADFMAADALLGLAAIARSADDPGHALELLAFVVQYEGFSHHERERAKGELATLADTLPQERVSVAREWAKEKTLEVLINEVLTRGVA